MGDLNLIVELLDPTVTTEEAYALAGAATTAHGSGGASSGGNDAGVYQKPHHSRPFSSTTGPASAVRQRYAAAALKTAS
jgi:hypothetical protein